MVKSAHNAAKMFARKVLKTNTSVFIRLGLHIFAGSGMEKFQIRDQGSRMQKF
jgi:hypothetical protein